MNKAEQEQVESSTPSNYRIRYVDTLLYGPQYQVETRKKTWYGHKWVGTHLCNTLDWAEVVIERLNARPQVGSIVLSDVS